MTCKKVYIGQELKDEDLVYGIGSVYLGGPRNTKGKSWRLDFIKGFERAKADCVLFIPETYNQLKGGFNKNPAQDRYQWEHMTISVASVILFWYPADVIDVQSSAQFGSWYKSERTFCGTENPDHEQYIHWLYKKQHKMYPCGSPDELIDMVVRWMKE